MRTKRLVTGALAALGTLLSISSGCSVVQGPSRPEWRVFALEPASDVQAATAPTRAAPRDAPVIVLAIPGSRPGYATRRMAYSRGGGELEYFASYRWADTPARMLIPLFEDALTRTGAFRAAVPAPTRVLGDFVVESEVTVFRQEVDSDAPRFRAAARVTVVRVGAGAAADSRVFEVEEPMVTAGPSEGVVAANLATARLVSEVVAYCADVAKAAH